MLKLLHQIAGCPNIPVAYGQPESMIAWGQPGSMQSLTAPIDNFFGNCFGVSG